jgi:hypothetical protein
VEGIHQQFFKVEVIVHTGIGKFSFLSLYQRFLGMPGKKFNF